MVYQNRQICHFFFLPEKGDDHWEGVYCIQAWNALLLRLFCINKVIEKRRLKNIISANSELFAYHIWFVLFVYKILMKEWQHKKCTCSLCKVCKNYFGKNPLQKLDFILPYELSHKSQCFIQLSCGNREFYSFCWIITK